MIMMMPRFRHYGGEHVQDNVSVPSRCGRMGDIRLGHGISTAEDIIVIVEGKDNAER
jgi:hypothetical protein